MKKRSFEVRAFRDRYLAAFALLLTLFLPKTASAQFGSPVHLPQAYDMLQVGKLFLIGGKDTTGYPAVLYPGALVFRQQPGDTSLYLSTGAAYMRVGAIPNAYITNSGTLQAGAVFNIERGSVNQANAATVATQFPSALPNPFNVIGGTAASTTFNSGTTATAARGGDINIRSGWGGAQLGAGVSFGGGGAGGVLDIRAGNGGTATGTGTSAGNGGQATIQGGDAGASFGGVNPGIAGSVKIGGGSQPAGSKGDGADIFAIPGARGTTGYRDGDVLLGTSPAFPVVRGRTLVAFPGGTLIPNTQRFQVNGTSWFGDTITLANLASVLLKANANGSVVQAIPGTDYVANITTGNLTETGSAILTITNGTGAVIGGPVTIQVKQANSTQPGFLTAADWNTFNSKAGAFTTGSLTEATSNVLTITGGTSRLVGGGTTIQVKQATSTQPGFLAAADWTTFNNKQNALSTGNLTEAGSSVLTISGGTGSVIGSGTTLQVKQAGSTQPGFLSASDWSTFNGKAPAFTTGNLTETGSSVLTITGGTGTQIGGNTTLQVKQASASTSGFLSSTDWSTFNSKGSGTVTSVAMALPPMFTVSGSPVTSTGTLTAALTTQGANMIFAGPISGGATAPTFRGLVAADIPQGSANYIQNQVASVQSGSGFNTAGDGFIAGNLSVGTTSALSKFTVSSDAGVTNTYHDIVSTYRTNSTAGRGVMLGYYANGTSETAGVVRAQNNGPLALNPGGGNVGVGTSAPATLFQVAGTATTSSLVTGTLQVTGGTLAAGKTLTSDATGVAAWSSGLVRGVRVITASTTLGVDDYTVINRTTSGTPVVTFPSASANPGRIYIIVEEAANVTSNGMAWTPAVTYKGATYTSWVNATLSSFSRLTVQSDGSNWVVIDGM